MNGVLENLSGFLYSLTTEFEEIFYSAARTDELCIVINDKDWPITAR